MVNYDIKSIAKDLAKENWNGFASLMLINIVLSVAYAVTDSTILILLLTIPLTFISYLVLQFSMSFARSEGREPWESAKDFNTIVSWLVATFMSSIFAFLWLLIPIAGIFIYPVKLCNYALVPYLAIDNPDDGFNNILRESTSLMKGYRMQWFLLNLSFIGWYILVGLTFGLASLFVVPYHGMAMAIFYLRRMASTD